MTARVAKRQAIHFLDELLWFTRYCRGFKMPDTKQTGPRTMVPFM
jgi:hypothetical protein